MGPVDVIYFVWVFLTGLMVGSFLNVCIHRIPSKSLSIVKPRSHCFSCGATIRWFDNIPLLSFVLLRARCRWCYAPISFRYPFIELVTGCAFLFQAWHGLWGDGGWSTHWQAYVVAVGGAVLFSGLLVVSAIDIDRRIIPDQISIPGMFVGIAFALFWAGAPRGEVSTVPVPLELFHQANVDSMFNGFLGVIVGGGSVYLIGWIFRAIMKKETMGFGDVKLLAACGGFIGWQGALIAFLLAVFVGAVTGIVYFIIRRSRYIPFGPSLSIGAMAYFWFHVEIEYFFLKVYLPWVEAIMGVPAP